MVTQVKKNCSQIIMIQRLNYLVESNNTRRFFFFVSLSTFANFGAKSPPFYFLSIV